MFPAATQFTDAFLASAEMLLDTEQTDLTVASLAILSISMICFGKDDPAKKYMSACIRMGEALHLFGTERYSNDRFEHLSADAMHMLSYVSWGAFNVSTYV